METHPHQERHQNEFHKEGYRHRSRTETSARHQGRFSMSKHVLHRVESFEELDVAVVLDPVAQTKLSKFGLRESHTYWNLLYDFRQQY